MDALRRLWVRVRCLVLPHDFGRWDEGLPPDFPRAPTVYFQYRRCCRCGLIRQRMIW